MGINKFDYFGVVKFDISNDTVASDKVLSGVTAHDKNGDSITGTLKVQSYRSGTSEPSDSLGDDGDLYLVLEE